VRKIYKKIAVLGLVSAFILILIAAVPIEVYGLQSSQHLHIGRIPIHAGEGVNTGTITAKAVCNTSGDKGVLTNAHVAHYNYPQIHSQSTQLIGTALGDKWHWSGSVDAAFIPFENPDKWEFSSSAAYFPRNYQDIHPRPYTIIPKTYQIGSREEIIDILERAVKQGEHPRVTKFGQSTGRTDGELRAVEASWIDHQGAESFYFEDMLVFELFAAEGDSGSPVFLIDNFGRYILIGIFVGGVGISGYQTWANKITSVTEALDITIKADFATICGFSYTILEDNTIKILGHADKNLSYINFPSYIINKPVTVITIPDNVTHISNSTFNNNPNLTTIIIEQTYGCPIVLETGAFLDTSISYIYFKNASIRNAFINCSSWIRAFTVNDVFRCYVFIAPVYTNRTVSFIWNSTATMGFTFEIYVPIDFGYADVLTYISSGQFSGKGGLGMRGFWVYLYHIYIVCIINGEVMGGDIYGDWVVHVTGGWFYIEGYRIIGQRVCLTSSRTPHLVYTNILFLKEISFRV